MRNYVIAIDPGKTTGVAVWEEGCLAATYELDFMKTCEFLATRDDRYEYVIEKFVINSRTATLSQAPWSLEVIGVARYLSGDRLIFQRPAEAKKAVPDSMLHKLRWWHAGGDGHANDALRHLVYYLMKEREPQLLARLDELNL